LSIAFVATDETPEDWLPGLAAALPGERFVIWPELGDTADVDIALAAQPRPGALAGLPNLKLIQSLWMGVDGLLADATLPRGVPIARLIDPGMVAAMGETVLAHVLDWHRHLYRYRAQQSAREWRQLRQHLAADRCVGLLGLGALGAECARRLVAGGFQVLGWSRRPRLLPAVQCFAGEDGLRAMLPRTQALVCLLPLTPGTRGILDAGAFALLPRHACVINVARGAHVVEADLLVALDSGHLAHAYLDVFEREPLPPDHPYWTHPKITLTPHVAALTEPRTAIPEIAANIARVRRGETPRGLVDRASGY
jgi:glyoxylate/hydroxypyruvate reductase A